MRIGIIGSGAAGLAAGMDLAKKGHHVEVFERDANLGGLAGSFLLDGGHVEKFYHFICLHDRMYLDMLGELQLSHLLRWRLTDMGQYYAERLFSFGRPADLLRFPFLSWKDKLRFALSIFAIKTARWEDWNKIADIPVNDWLKATFSPNIFRIFHEPMVRLKFGRHSEQLSAAWMWARIHRLGRSRTRIRQREKIGYVEGGSQIVMDAMAERITAAGGRIILQSNVQSLVRDGGRVVGLKANDQEFSLDAVISTIAVPAFLRLVPGPVEGEYWTNLRKIESIGVVCVFLQASRSFSRFFWINISAENLPLAGIVEYTNLNPLPHLGGDSVIYLPQYLPSDDERFRWTDETIVDQYLGYLQHINPDFRKEHVKRAFVFREKYAQPICSVGFDREIPPIKTPLKGLYVTDSSQLHPDDRTISNSLGLGRKAATIVDLESKSQ